jgi:hypothetical protein
MKALRLGELKEVLQASGFTGWWADFSRAGAELTEATDRRQDLLSQAELMELRSELVQRSAMDAFSDGGEAEEGATRLGVEAQELENQALVLVALFEEQRYKASDLWYRLGGLERSIEEATDEAVRRQLEKQLPAVQKEYGVEEQKRNKLWAEVEEAWARSFERSLLSHEHGDRARRIRREAERLFKEAEERRLRARQLKAEAEVTAREVAAASQRRAQLLERAAREFGCIHGDRFLYWRRRDDQRASFAVALQDDAESYNIEVKALSAYSVGPLRGVGFLEPAREGLAPTVQEGDRRFEEYLLGPRAGVRRGEGGPGTGDGPAKP